MTSKDYLLEGAALAHVVQMQLLIAVVFMAQDADRSLDRVRQLSLLRRRMLALRESAARPVRGRHRRARSRL